MCSNACNTACACGTGGNAVTNIWSSGLKKQQKRPRVPKRGPGVAELEKILREQENIDTTDKGNPEGFPSFLSHHSNSYPSSSLKFHPLQSTTSKTAVPPSSSPLSCNLPTNVPSAPKFDHLGPTMLPTTTSIYGSLERNSGSDLVSPEKELFPLNLNSCKSNLNINEPIDGHGYDSANSPFRNLSNESNHIWPYGGNIQKRSSRCSPPRRDVLCMMETKKARDTVPEDIRGEKEGEKVEVNQFHGTSSSSALSSALHNHLELPSNQSSYHNNYIYRVSDENKMGGMKRSYSSALENSLIPPSNFHVLPSFSHYNRPHQSSINDSHGASSFNSTKECYRDDKWGSTLELSNTRFNSDIATPGHANYPSFVSPEVPSPSMHLFPNVLSKGNVLSCQVNDDKMEAYQHSESSEPIRRPFYNFLEVEDPEVTETMHGTNRGGCEAGRVGIDLNLKL
ncbi:hypothetical protein Fmac_009748 [Flemingia macrophylla]|uniref:Uncharacterized protein n=1 Tax=Flemingia macrophylla TaxID=520843 RepID=A0ABD1N2E2_9FABA